MEQKFYVVYKGHKPGIYTNYDDVKTQITHFSGALHKKFNSLYEAQKTLKNYNEKTHSPNVTIPQHQNVPSFGICVDASYQTTTNATEWQAVDLQTKSKIFSAGPFLGGSNNIGEFIAIVHALWYIKKNRLLNTPIYSDSQTAIDWIKKAQSNSKITMSQSSRISDALNWANHWLKENPLKNQPIYKWQTKSWGEIPADFGRK